VARLTSGAGAPVYAVAGGNHVTMLVDARETGGEYDLIVVRAMPGGGPPPHAHAFWETFHVLEGEVQFTGERDGAIAPTLLARAGDTVTVGPWEWHGTLNRSDAPARFVVVGRPGEMSGYFAEAGVRVADEGAAPAVAPPGPSEVAAIAERYDIRFWTGPVRDR
jgi:quercetin dioxygenase-like cupin family protein